jgi:chromosome partitioning protein
MRTTGSGLGWPVPTVAQLPTFGSTRMRMTRAGVGWAEAIQVQRNDGGQAPVAGAALGALAAVPAAGSPAPESRRVAPSGQVAAGLGWPQRGGGEVRQRGRMGSESHVGAGSGDGESAATDGSGARREGTGLGWPPLACANTVPWRRPRDASVSADAAVRRAVPAAEDPPPGGRAVWHLAEAEADLNRMPIAAGRTPRGLARHMIANTRQGALSVVLTESEDEVATPAARDKSADTPIARAAEVAMSVRAGRDVWPRPESCRILTIANQKGGVGKTTTAVNVAASLAMHGSRVLVVDLDPQGNASTALDVEHRSGTPSVYSALVDGLPFADVVKPVEGFTHLYCAPATIDLAGAEIELVPQVARESRLERALGDFDVSEYDYIFIDCPPSLGLLTVNALVAAPEVLIPIQCEYYALEGLGQLLRTIELVKSHLNPPLTVTTILLTMFDSRTKLASQVADDVRGHFGDLVLSSVIPRSVRVSEAPGFSQSVMTYDPGSSGAVAYLEAAKEMAFKNTATAA